MKKKTMIIALTTPLVISASLAWGATRITALPYTITTSGDYYITSNLTSTGNGILVNASNVSIDLQGQTISGTNHNGDAIYINGSTTNLTNLEIMNGTVTGFNTGISFYGDGANTARVINVKVLDISGWDTLALGPNSLIKDCTIGNNNDGPSLVGQGSMVTGSISFNNQGYGFTTSEGATIIGNTVYGNHMDGISAGTGSTVKNNTAYGNYRYGITLTDYNMVDGNSSYNNNQDNNGYTNISSCTTCVFGNNVAP